MRLEANGTSSFFSSTERKLLNKWKLILFPPNRVIQNVRDSFYQVCESRKSGEELTCVYVRNAVNEFSYSGADNTSDSKGD